MSTISTCLWFNDQGEDAARFYTSLVPNSAIGAISHYGDGAPQPAGSVMTVEFTLDGQQYVALSGGPEFTLTEAVSIQLSCANQAEVDRYWAAFAEGGKEGPCGWVTDRFGLSWQVVPARFVELVNDPDPAVVQRVMAAMFTMGKLDVAELERAAAA